MLQCHKTTPQECETGAIMCSYMNSCSGNGACNDATGKCTCKPGFMGADCSETVNLLPATPAFSQRYSVQGVNWLYFQFADGLQAG